MKRSVKLFRMIGSVIVIIFLTTAYKAPAVQTTAAVAPAVPSATDLQRVEKEAYEKFKNVTEGKNADYIPELAKVPSDLFGVVMGLAIVGFSPRVNDEGNSVRSAKAINYIVNELWLNIFGSGK